MSDSPSDVTELLQAWSDGDAGALDRLVPLVYEELRSRAAASLRREDAGHTLQPTALVHEAYLRLVDQRRIVWKSRSQFLGVAAEMMRRILVDHARGRGAAKRAGGWTRVTLDGLQAATEPDVADVDMLDLDDAMTRLAEFDPRGARIAELRFFGGLKLRETAELLNISIATVERDWQAARAWLFDQLADDPS